MGPLFDMLRDRFQLESLASFEMELMPEMPCIMDIRPAPIPQSLLMKALPEIPSSDLGSWAEDALMDIGRSAGRDSHSKGRQRDSKRSSKQRNSKRKDSKQRDSKQSIDSAGSRGSSGSHPNRHFHLPELKLSRVSIGTNGIVSPDGSIIYDTPLRREFEELERLFGNSDDSDSRRDTWPPNSGSLTDSDGYDGDESPDESPVIKSPMIRMIQDQTPGLNEKTYQVLPAALKQYGIEADWWDYELWVTFNGGERMFDDDEKPLEIFKQMARDGMEPMLKLRKKQLDSPVSDGDSL
ncbi:Adaptor for signal transduction [Orbilia ellipsospora]|uniref:Adaptor for signal transduction n=1 Tax=Orbilia ellipsospora TaxID=2528407 RepID=A0AAV9XN32_9PEZI